MALKNSHLTAGQKASLAPVPEVGTPVVVLRPIIAPITTVTETRKIIPAGVAITETEQEIS